MPQKDTEYTRILTIDSDTGSLRKNATYLFLCLFVAKNRGFLRGRFSAAFDQARKAHYLIYFAYFFLIITGEKSCLKVLWSGRV